MATSITTNLDLLQLEVMTAAEINRLMTPEAANSVTALGVSFPWRYRHERAWARILRDLSLRPHRVTEADITDTSELKLASCYLVAAIAYASGETKEDQHRTQYFNDFYEREINEVQLTVAGGQQAPAGMTVIRAYRC
jgi:hypothetical protein